jgi:hypothetical protein
MSGSMPTRTSAPNAPQLFLWRGQSLVIGIDTDSRMHSHFAAQLSWGIDGPFRARLAADLDWQTCRAAIFAPNQMHQIDCGGQALAHIFIELPQRQQTDITCLNAPYADAPGFASVRAAITLAQDGALGIAGAQRALHDWLTCALPAHTAHIARATSVPPDTSTTPHPTHRRASSGASPAP